MRRLWCAFGLAALVASVPAAGDMQLQGVGADHACSCRHDRFYAGADRDFLFEAMDFSGVGRAAGGAWATMISPSYFVSANHFHPAAGEAVTFCAGNGLAAPAHTLTVAGGMRIGGSDLWLGWFAEPAPAAVAHYPILWLDDERAYLGQEIVVYGKPDRVGLNHVDDIRDRSGSRALIFGFDAAGGAGESEAYLMVGDSGGPSFVAVGGALALVGVHSFHSSAAPSDGAQSGDCFLPFYVGPIGEVMIGEQADLFTPVPEPTASAVWCFAILTSLARRRR